MNHPMLHLLKRHPLAVKAHFEHVLVLTYALSRDVLMPLLPHGLALDTYEDFGFVAVAMVQTRDLRPSFVPRAFGRDFFLTGYRIFTRFNSPSGQSLKGLKILRSDTDQPGMVFWGNLLTHYDYRKAQIACELKTASLEISVETQKSEADLHVIADLSSQPAPLPAGSPFPDLKTARKYAGPLPYTFDYERESHSIIMIRGVRHGWTPQPIKVEVLKNSFLEREPFRSADPILANAFYISDIPYLWDAGVRVALPMQESNARPIP